MMSTKFGFYSRIIKLATKTYSHSKYDFKLQNSSHLPLACIYTLRKSSQKTHILSTTNDAQSQVSPSLKYSTKPIQVPPLMPEPPPPETDVFGSLGGLKYEKVELDEEELKEEERLKNIHGKVPRKFKPTPGQYAKMIKTYVEKGDLKSAEEVIEECKRNRDKPTDYMFSLLIRTFAIQGDIKKCYKYFSEMKARQYKIKPNVFTSLFNACANSPESDKALNYLERVQSYMNYKNVPLGHAHYNCLVKAYGRHNKLEMSYKILEEMMQKKLKIGISTINSLMYAANSDKESGLKHVLRIWQMMRHQRVPPDIFSYNLLFRAIRDCKFGNSTVNELLLESKEHNAIIVNNNRPDLLLYPPILSDLPLENIHRKDVPKIEGLISAPKDESSTSTHSESSDSTVSDVTDDYKEPLPASITSLDLDAILKQNKLILFGGLESLFEKMKNDRIEPTVKTLTYLIEIVPDSTTAEEMVIRYAKKNKIPLDVDFFNMLIKKRCIRGSKAAAKTVVDEIHKADLKPNIVTYGVLALSCSTSKESRDLLSTMKSTGHTINKYVADALLNNAFYKLDFGFILELMEHMRWERVRLDEETFEKLDQFQKKMSELIISKHRYAQTERFKLGFSKFNMRYKSWQEQMGRKIVAERDYKMETEQK
ncbi:hypothetical protein TSAR_004607 [Trichomalopsis sarcophagae]|uniref:Pentacotripeptide-repeat region of PRORP domain-containing protein n=1 Tax=Trichomalopsis sarcophagae TaxID=543379 RepID=A0A232EWS5_9HYME|nr:hypothetical protein TSAR_004607 [Trichomalopsis sarcophagae]